MKSMQIYTKNTQRENDQEKSKLRARRISKKGVTPSIPPEEILVIESFLLNEVLEILAEE